VSGVVSLAVGDGDCDGLDVWTGDVEEVGDEDGEVAGVLGDGDCDSDCDGLAVAVADPDGHGVAEDVANGERAVGIELGPRPPGPGAVVEAGLVLVPPPVDTY
jgi:hypothetical protein